MIQSARVPAASSSRAPSRRRLGVPLALAVVSGAVAFPAAGQQDRIESPARSLQEDRAKAKALERAVREDRGKAQILRRAAEDLAREIQTLRAQSISAARNAQDYETKLSGLETRLEELERRREVKVADLKARHAQLGGTLAALQRIAVQPVDALIVAPRPPIDTVRSAMLLGAAIPVIEGRASALRAELDELAGLRREIALRRGELAVTVEALEIERARLANLIRRKGESWATVAAEQRAMQQRAARMAVEAKDLRDLIRMVEREARERAARERQAREQAARETEAQAAREAETEARSEPNEIQAAPETPARAERTEPAAGAESEARVAAPAGPGGPAATDQTAAPDAGAPAPSEDQVALARPANIRPFPVSRASLVMPSRGRVVLRYGQPRSNKTASRGVLIAARNRAQVVAPYDGKVVYAGTFRRYGKILIIEHGERYHTLLAGLDQIDAVVGQWLLAGEPVGRLGSSEGGDSELYLELRRAGQPINPLPWLATTGDKARG